MHCMYNRMGMTKIKYTGLGRHIFLSAVVSRKEIVPVEQARQAAHLREALAQALGIL